MSIMTPRRFIKPDVSTICMGRKIEAAGRIPAHDRRKRAGKKTEALLPAELRVMMSAEDRRGY